MQTVVINLIMYPFIEQSGVWSLVIHEEHSEISIAPRKIDVLEF